MKPSLIIYKIAEELQRKKNQSLEVDDGAMIRAIMQYLDEEYEKQHTAQVLENLPPDTSNIKSKTEV